MAPPSCLLRGEDGRDTTMSVDIKEMVAVQCDAMLERVDRGEPVAWLSQDLMLCIALRRDDARTPWTILPVAALGCHKNMPAAADAAFVTDQLRAALGFVDAEAAWEQGMANIVQAASSLPSVPSRAAEARELAGRLVSSLTTVEVAALQSTLTTEQAVAFVELMNVVARAQDLERASQLRAEELQQQRAVWQQIESDEMTRIAEVNARTIMENDARLGRAAAAAYEQLQVPEMQRITVVESPNGLCDGSRQYAYDPFAEDGRGGRGARLAVRCPGCRACS